MFVVVVVVVILKSYSQENQKAIGQCSNERHTCVYLSVATFSCIRKSLYRIDLFLATFVLGINR